MCLSYLPAQDQPDAGAALLGREERNEQVCRVRQAGAFISNPDVQVRARTLPTGADTTSGFERRIGEYEARSPGADWDGVFVAVTK